jgi:hypothetical protein
MIYLEDSRTIPGLLQNIMEHRMSSSNGRDVELVGGRVAVGSRSLCSQAEQERIACNASALAP